MSDSASTAQLVVDVADGVAVVTLTNPHRHNALSNQTFGHDLPELVRALADRSDVRALVVTGAGHAFCAGSELDAEGFSRLDEAEVVDLVQRVNDLPMALRDLGKPSIAAVQGVAIGGGVGVAAACDLRVASPRARFRVPYVQLGLTPDVGLSHTLPAIIGVARALELVLTGRWLDADEALATGLVTILDEDPLRRAVSLAAAMAECSPGAVAAARGMIVRAPDRTMDETLLEHEPQQHARLLHADDRHTYFTRYLASIGLKLDAGGRIRRD
ncbi:MAG: enoyl-CoA hydratase/isomerase family protein [Aeromicrobium sp.]